MQPSKASKMQSQAPRVRSGAGQEFCTEDSLYDSRAHGSAAPRLELSAIENPTTSSVWDYAPDTSIYYDSWSQESSPSTSEFNDLRGGCISAAPSPMVKPTLISALAPHGMPTYTPSPTEYSPGVLGGCPEWSEYNIAASIGPTSMLTPSSQCSQAIEGLPDPGPDFAMLSELDESLDTHNMTSDPGLASPKSVKDAKASSSRMKKKANLAKAGVEARAATDEEASISNLARTHPFYKMTQGPDDLYHCPFADSGLCSYQPEKLRCNYNKHIDSHLKPYSCQIAGCKTTKKFSSTACLLRHEREAHGMHGHGQKPYQCHIPHCTRSQLGHGFPRQWNLRDHIRRVHLNGKSSHHLVARSH